MPARSGEKKWIAVTAGFAPSNFHEAANRVEKELLGLYPFYKILNFGFRDLSDCVPETLAKYQEFLDRDVPGFGHYSWKSEIVNRTLNGEFGECDGVVWIDGGCEILKTPWTKHKFSDRIREAENIGYLVYQLDTPESQYTKKEAFKLFQDLDERDMSGQVQANYFFLYGELGRRVSASWAQSVLRGIGFLDDSQSPGGEVEFFKSHKADQSLLSLVMKSFKAERRMKPPPAGNRGVISQLRAINDPIWVSRNRGGDTIKNPIIRLIERSLLWVDYIFSSIRKTN